MRPKGNSSGIAVILPIHDQVALEHIKASIDSILRQTIKPDELILVADGYLPLDVQNLLQLYTELPFVKFLQLKVRSGVGVARAAGIDSSISPLIAIMDSDDISVSNRFEIQKEIFEKYEIDVLGGLIEEFSESPSDLKRLRLVPQTQENILKMAKLRSPMNHVTVMMKRSAYEKVGGYSNFKYAEDYDLFVKLILNDAKFKNLNEVLVYVRAGNGMINRRRNYEKFKNDMIIISLMKNHKFITSGQAFLASFLRLCALTLPTSINNFLYKAFLREAKQATNAKV